MREPRVFDFLQDSHYVESSPEVWRLALDATAGVTDTWQAALALLQFIHAHFKYESHSTHVHTHMRDVLRERRGVCQDFAHVMIGLCRVAENSRALCQRLSRHRNRQRHPRLGGSADSRAPAGSAWTPRTTVRWTKPTSKSPSAAITPMCPPVAGNYKGTTDRKLEVGVHVKRLA